VHAHAPLVSLVQVNPVARQGEPAAPSPLHPLRPILVGGKLSKNSGLSKLIGATFIR